MDLRALFSRIADDSRPHGTFERALQVGLAPVGLLYGAGASLRRNSFESVLRKPFRLSVPVISVGNITLGGTGKTPFCIWLVRWLQAQGRQPVVLTRGYGRADEQRLVVVHDGKSITSTADEAGDEAVLLARSLDNVPIVACADRAAGGRHPIEKFACDLIVLDDGFQHLALHRDADIVLVDATRHPDRLRVFPRGSLREPLAALKRAHLFVLTRCNQAPGDGIDSVDWLQARFPQAPVVRTTVVTDGARRLVNGEILSVDTLVGGSAVLACGVANPDSVRASARAAGLQIAAEEILPDHARISPADIQRWDSLRRDRGADFLIITEKDAARLGGDVELPDSLFALISRVGFHTAEDEARANRQLAALVARSGLRP